MPVLPHANLTLDAGLLNVLILFNVLRALSPAIRSTSTAVGSDPEKGRLERSTVSRPADDWMPQSTFAPPTQNQVTRTAPQAHPPITTLHGLVPSRPASRTSSLWAHKKTGSTTSATRLLTPPDSESPSPSHSPSSSLGGAELSVSPTLIQKSIASVLDAELTLPPPALQIDTRSNPQLHLLTRTSSSQSNSNATGLTPGPRRKRSRVSRNLSPIAGSPATVTAPQTTLPVIEAAAQSPATSASPIDVGSLVNLYFSDAFASSDEPPLSPPSAIYTNGSADLSIASLRLSASPTTPLPATSFIDHALVVPPEDATRPLKAYVSVGAVGGGRRFTHPPSRSPTSSPAPLVSPADSTDASHYSDSETGPPPSQPSLLPLFQSTQSLRLSRSASVSAHASAEGDRQTLELPLVPRAVHRRQAPRSLPPTPPGPPKLTRTSIAHLHATRPRREASRSSHHGYL